MIGVMISQANTLDYLHAINLFPKVIHTCPSEPSMDEHDKKDGYFFTSDGSLVLSSLLQILTIIFHPV